MLRMCLPATVISEDDIFLDSVAKVPVCPIYPDETKSILYHFNNELVDNN